MFYLGCYLIQQDSLEPRHTGAWLMPDLPTQHMAETSNVEDLNVLPTKMASIPTQIQYGCTLWTSDEGFSADDPFKSFYVKTQESFYLIGFTAGSELYDTFYVKTQEPFYVIGFSAGSELYDTFYVKTQESFYIQGFTAGSELYDTFYVKTQEHFYIRSFTPVDTWTEFYIITTC